MNNKPNLEAQITTFISQLAPTPRTIVLLGFLILNWSREKEPTTAQKQNAKTIKSTRKHFSNLLLLIPQRLSAFVRLVVASMSLALATFVFVLLILMGFIYAEAFPKILINGQIKLLLLASVHYAAMCWIMRHLFRDSVCDIMHATNILLPQYRRQ